MIFSQSHWELVVKRLGRDCYHVPSGLHLRCLLKTQHQKIDGQQFSGWSINYVATFFHEDKEKFKIGDSLQIDSEMFEIEEIKPESEFKVTYVLSKS